MKKEELIKSFQALTMEDKIEVMKIILPEFCQRLPQQPELRQEMMKLMMNFCEQNMAAMMGGMVMMNMDRK